MSQCELLYTSDKTEQRRCPRSAHADTDGCVFHLSPDDRHRADISPEVLREAFRSDSNAGVDSRREYVDVHFERLDLSSLVIDGEDVGQIRFRNATIEDTLDLSGSIVRHPIALDECQIGRLDLTGATFEADLSIDESVLGRSTDVTNCLRCRRSTFERSLDISASEFDGSIEFAGCRIEDWLDVDGVTVSGRAYFPNASIQMAQFIGTQFESDAGFEGMVGGHVSFERVGFANPPDFSEVTIETFRMRPAEDVECFLGDATISGGRLDQPENGVALYDLTDATVGDVDLDCDVDTFDRYRFYRTRFEGFPFASYRRFLRANQWRMHEYAGTPDESANVEGLELTYLEAKQGASAVGDSENASAFFVRELRYRRRYAEHLTDPDHGGIHRLDAALRWLTNGFLDLVAGYGERPQRIVVVALAVVIAGAIVYPATGGLASGNQVVTYTTDGVLALIDGLYFSIATFATLGLGDIHPVGDIGRMLAASEAIIGAFLTALFVFSLGRRVTR